MSRFHDEIEQLPAALERMIDHYRSPQGRASLSRFRQLAHPCRLLQFSGMGSSSFAPLAVRPMLLAGRRDVQIVESGEWLHYGGVAIESSIRVMISQSGESVEVRRLVDGGHATQPYIALTNSPDSTLGRGAALTLPLEAGEEAAITTKTYTNTLGLLHLATASLSDAPGALDEAFRALDRAAQRLLDLNHQQLDEAAAQIAATPIAFIARGPALASAHQSALTMIEGARCATAAYSAAAFRHGPLEAADEKLAVVVFLPQGATYEMTARLAREAAELGSPVVCFVDQDDPALQSRDRLNVIRVRRIHGEAGDALFPLLCSAAHALLVDRVARLRGIEAGQFRHGAKITTRE